MNEINRRLVNKAMQSSCRFRVSAVAISRSGDVLGFYKNQHRISSKGQSTHAEIAAIKSLGRKIKTLIICRVGNNGALLPIHPCETCKKIAARYGIEIKTIEGIT